MIRPDRRGGEMTETAENGASDIRQRANRRIIAPVRPRLVRAGALMVVSGALWPVQAALVAWAIAGWVSGDAAMTPGLAAAAGFALLGFLRALLERRAGGLLFDAADATIARERRVLIEREARAESGVGSAALAALTVQKIPLLQPWITRYHVAMIRVAVLPALLFAVAFSVSWVVGLILLVAGPLIPVFMALVGLAAEQVSRRQMQEIGTMNDMLMDRLSAMTDIRLLGAAGRAAEEFAVRAETLRDRTMAVLRVAFLSSAVLELFAALGVALVAVFVGFSLLGEIRFGSWARPLTVGEGVFLLLIAPEFFQPLRDLAAAWHDRAAGLAVVEELEALDARPRRPIVGKGDPSAPLPGALNLCLSGAVAVLPAAKVRLPDLTVGAGQSVAITGPSGAGKSTTLAAIAGLVPLADGRIEVCGRVLADDTADAWRARLALVPQHPHFSDVALGDWLDPGGCGSDPWAALRAADAEDVVRRLPGGLSARLGETGGGLSGGEARRLMLARAVLSGAELILADEPTADLDADTARRIIAALLGLTGEGRTVVVATHDPVLADAMAMRVEVPA
ncbi:thiol reductant ABC exporter subunit CydD [Primorskyibacter flagellatus]|uniref:Thiol reductant ABC exporter subunit CydD n=1 Tax=Primorskyibacter flagellatus TaxID=1387277 RepID=A0A916ZWL0_9RHOB|nr:ATP-binding cassette domain-containing protein [Primorskyibacter flagellatus]GGE16121.1 thiol reductant ABC exporter subunit CydD [Primorskyibacter flagellatus]